MPRSILLLVAQALLLGARVANAAPAAPSEWPSVTPVGLRAVVGVLDPQAPAPPLGVRAWAPAPDTAAPMPLTVAPVSDPAALDSVRYEGPTLDSLAMSRWERLWWGRRGAFRVTGLFPTHPDNPADDFRQIARVRRWMLGVHQKLGLVTVGAMAAQVVSGQVAIARDEGRIHRTLAPITIGLYSTTAALSLLAPPPLFRGEGGVDTITIHKWLAIGHMAGMIATPLLAPDEASERRLHQVLGYSTFATFSAAVLTVTFFR